MSIRYPKRQCKNPACSEKQFVPKRPNQIFCDKQCKNYYHNQEKKKKRETIFNKERILKHNYECLKKLSTNVDYKKSVPEIILKHEKVNLTVFTDQSINESTNRKILWSHDLGLEMINDSPSKHFIIHRR